MHRLSEELLQTAHAEKINALAFPVGYSEVFATAAPGCIRVWHLDSCRELLRISVPNLECKCLVFAVVSGWCELVGVGAFGAYALCYLVGHFTLPVPTSLQPPQPRTT